MRFDYSALREELLPSEPTPAIRDDRLRGIVAGRTGDAAAGMGTRATVIEAPERSAIVCIAQHGPRREQLVEREGAVEDVAAERAELLFQIERAQGLARDDARLEAGRVAVDRVDHHVGDFFTMIMP